MKLETSSRRRPQSLNAVAAEIAAAVLVHVSFWLLVLSMLSIQLAPWAIVTLVLLPVLLYLVTRIPGVGNLMPVYSVFLPLFVGLVGVRYFGEGLRELFNYLAKALNRVHELAVFPLGQGYPKGTLPGLPAQLVLLLAGFLMAGLFAYALGRKVRWLAIPVTVLPALAGFFAGLRPTVPAFIFFLVAATFYLILLETRSKGTARRLTWLNGEISAALLLFLMALALLLSGFDRSERIEDLRKHIVDRVTTFRYAPDEETEAQPGGDLNRADSLHYKGETVLTIETPNAFSMYLRGFSGDVLDKGKWQPLSSDAYFHDYSLTGPWIRSNFFSPAISFGQLLDLKWQVQTTQYENGERDAVTLPRYPVTIHNERAYSNTMFAPYEVSAESKGLRRADLSQEGLKAEGLKGKRSYELTVYQPLTKDYGSVSAKSVIGDDTPYNSLYEEAFAPTEKVYRAFVKENELAVPEEYAEYLGPLAKAVLGSPRNPNEVIRRIRAYFNTNYTYSLELPEKATGADPFLQFLSTRTGYDAHFATLAALLLREAGIPARYAEGYLVSEELAASVPKEEDVVLEVPDSASHAWVELYMEGVGWVPLEMTPGFYESKGSPKGAGTTSEETVVQPEEVPEPVDNGEDTSEEGGGGEGDTPKENDPEETAHFHWALVLLPVLLLLLLVPLLWDYRIRKRIERADSPETVAVAYRYLMRVFRFRGLRPDEHRPKAIAPLLGDGKDAYLSALELMYKESFSEEGLTPPERAQVCETVLDLTGDLKLLRHARRQVKESSKPDREAHHGK